MGLLSPGFGIATRDPRLELLAYLTDGKQPFEVVKITAGGVTLENCRTEIRFTMPVIRILRGFTLVRAAPKVPSHADDAGQG